MADRPILFTGPMVRAILDGHKTMTRRISPKRRWFVGDRLWVREPHYKWTGIGEPPAGFVRDRCYFDHPELDIMDRSCSVSKKPSIHMPRWASRITLDVTGVRSERLQEITNADAVADGILAEQSYDRELTPREAFAALWDSINAKRGYGWGTNPTVWVIGFRSASNG